MKKIFSKIAVILTVSSLTLPLTACVFNFYGNSASNVIVKNFATQTSSIIKSLIMAKEQGSDTSQTITDILNQFPNSSIKNQTSDIDLKTWEDFTKYWGFEKKINIKGFNTTDYFKASGTGQLTKQVNNYKNLTNTLDKLKLIIGINVANNRTIYNLIQNNTNVKTTIINFLNQTKKTNPDELPSDSKDIITLLKNIVIGKDWQNPNKNAFQNNLIEPLNSFLDYLVDGWWAPNTPTPWIPNLDKTNDPLDKFMNNWKDKSDSFYSQWNNNKYWTLPFSYYKNWNKTDYNFYRSGVLINYLFYKIGKDYQIKKPNSTIYKDRYLGDIINSYITLLPPSFDTQGLGNDLKQYLPYLLKNPQYILLIVEAIIPIIKQWALQMSDITKGVKNLTFGQKYKTNDSINSYNIFDILKQINYLLTHPNELEKIIKSLIGWAPEGTPGRTLLYDLNVIYGPLGYWMGEGRIIPASTKQDLINSAMNFINTDTVKNTFKNILNIFNNWIKQYDDKGQGINFDLTKLKDFLLNNNNGLITIINRDIIPTLYSIFTDPESLNDAKYLEFYKSIGGEVPENPNEEPPINFRKNSLLSIVKNKISNPNEPLGQIAIILFGNSSENISGIFDFIIKSNNQWIYDNYTKFFDINNKSNESIYNNLTMTTNTKNDVISDTLSYNLIYKINNRTYHFSIKCKSYDEKNSYTGTKNFKFTDIILHSVK